MIDRKVVFSLRVMFAVLIVSSSALADESHVRHHTDAFVESGLILNAKGRAVAYACEIPPTALGTTTALCFDLPLYNMKTGAYVGVLQDRLADVIPQEGGGLLVTVTSTFRFTEWRSTPQLTTRVLGSVQPFIEGSPTMTHLTGAIPSAGDNNILSGTKRFTHATGTARESGAVNLAGFQGEVGDEVIFDLIWHIKFD